MQDLANVTTEEKHWHFYVRNNLKMSLHIPGQYKEVHLDQVQVEGAFINGYQNVQTVETILDFTVKMTKKLKSNTCNGFLTMKWVYITP